MAKILQDQQQAIFNHYDQIASRALANYAIDPRAVVRPLNYSENVVYLIEERVSKTRFILRVGKPDYHNNGEVEAELAWMSIVKKESKIEIPDVVKGINGKYVQKLLSDESDAIYYCVLFTFLSGQSLDDDLNALPIYFEQIGEIAAEFHNINSKNLIKLGDFKRPVWNYETTLGVDAKWGRWQEGLGIDDQKMNVFQRVADIIQKRLERFGVNDDRFGLIHADLRTVNLLAEGEKLKVIDFDDCGFSWYLYDLAASLSFIEHMDYVPKLVKLWLSGYRKHRYLSLEEEHEIPTFIMMRRLALLGWVGSHSDTETAKEMGRDFTIQTERLAKHYLKLFS
ncbi:phosphotransferase enzyme family protein [Sporolactobacillus terrae]|uniref:phosphotransferase enzyme family protein n=1 Tax=Sporolactobacillus terrae TaxID=269673 RepID=UPI00068498C0|nr:phosphotransferase [Sporolactobacillus terrae]